MKKFIKKNQVVIIAIFFSIAIPLVIFLFVGDKTSIGDWLGFLGSYIGSIITIIFSYVNTQYQLKSSERQKDMLALRGLFNSSKKLSLRFTRYIVLLNQLMQKSDKPLDKKVLAVFFEQSEKFFDESKDYLDNYNSAIMATTEEISGELKSYNSNFSKEAGKTFLTFTKMLSAGDKKNTQGNKDVVKVRKDYLEEVKRLEKELTIVHRKIRKLYNQLKSGK